MAAATVVLVVVVDPPTPWHCRPLFTTDTDIRMGMGGGMEGRKAKAHIKKWGAHADRRLLLHPAK